MASASGKPHAETVSSVAVVIAAAAASFMLAFCSGGLGSAVALELQCLDGLVVGGGALVALVEYRKHASAVRWSAVTWVLAVLFWTALVGFAAVLPFTPLSE